MIFTTLSLYSVDLDTDDSDLDSDSSVDCMQTRKLEEHLALRLNLDDLDSDSSNDSSLTQT